MNQQAMLKKARQLQQEMLETQKEIDATEFTANVGPISLTMNGAREIIKLVIEKDYELASDEDRELLEDSVVAASSKLSKEISDYTEEKMSKYKAFLGGF